MRSATVLVVGSHPVLLEHVATDLRSAGWATIAVLGPEAAFAMLEHETVDALVLGGPAAMAAQDALVDSLKRRNPYAHVVLPGDPQGVPDAVRQAFGVDAD